MSHHRLLARTVGALVLSAPLLTGCGFNYATDRVNTTTNATFNRDASVDVVGAQIIAAGPGSGSLHARLVNNEVTGTELVSVTGSGDTLLSVGEVPALVLGADQGVNIEDVDGGLRLEGDFIAGDVVPLALTFATGEEVLIEVPVIRACDFAEGLDTAPEIESTSGEASGDEVEPYSCESPTESHSE